MRIWCVLALCLTGLALLRSDAGAASTEAGSSVVMEGPIDHDLYLAGRSVEVKGAVDGDVVAAGGRVVTGDDIAGGVIAAGGTVEVRGTVKRSVRVAGGDVTAAAQVGRDLTAAGGTVTLAREARVAGDVWIAAAHIAVNGGVGKDLEAIGANIALSGTVEGDAHLRGHWITIGPEAVIHGRLTYQSDTAAEVDRRARIDGGVTRSAWPAPQRAETAMHIVGYVAKILLALGLIAAGLLFILVFPGYSLNAARLIGLRPLASLGLGFALLVATPVAVVIAMASMLGAILGMVVFAAYFVSLLLAVLTAVIFLGDGLLRLLGRGPLTGIGRRLAALILGVIALVVLSGLPYLGGFVVLAALAVGLGAFYLEAAERY
jgi:cytoskeletal protein CcmA (bactofilin family)